MATDALGQKPDGGNGRVLLLTTPQTYRTEAFVAAADRLGVEAVRAINLPAELAHQWPDYVVLDFDDLDGAVAAVAALHQNRPLDAILAVDDSGSRLAARASAALGLPHNAPLAAEAARNKLRMREVLRQAGVNTPWFHGFPLSADWQAVAEVISFPAVVKPLELSGSRGVMRVDDAAGLRAALARLKKMLEERADFEEEPAFLVEEYIPGAEVALEGLLDDGALRVLALFDKPDPLEGPFFEETIYVTPSRLPPDTQAAIAACTARAAAALGLRRGPIHAELRLNERGPWLVEAAGRSIGGLCSQTLRFGVDASLEELILRQACGLPIDGAVPGGQAAGVMMIPIPEAGMLRGVAGIEAAEAVPLIEGVELTARINYPLIPLPEGESYLGFIFARGDSPAAVEAALREAHGRLRFEISPYFPMSTV